MTRNAVQLITYADRLAGDLAGLSALMASEPWASAFSGVHVLPFYTPFDGADAGFDPIDHTAVDPRLGTWEDVAALSRAGDTMVDIIVNHVSSESAGFLDYLDKGEESEYAGMYLTMSSIFPNGATEDELAGIYRPRPGLPFSPYTAGGVKRLIWTTFTPQQIDIDISNEKAQAYLDSILDAVSAAGVSMVRLDAVGYGIKTPGTTCFMTPETFEFIHDFTERARARGVEVLVEVHSYYKRQIEIGHEVDRVYDFALPPLLLHALGTGDVTALEEWLRIRPANAVTVLDTHDGIGVIDVGPDQTAPDRPGLLPPDDIHDLVERIHDNTRGTSRLATGAAASNLDLYQVNSTYYDALGSDDNAYLIARAIQFFVPGIPQVYYVGALCASNDTDLLKRTGVGRDINRHYFTDEQITVAMRRPVVRALFELCRFRSTVPVFDGDFSVTADAEHSLLALRWDHEGDWAELRVDLSAPSARLAWSWNGESGDTDDLVREPPAV